MKKKILFIGVILTSAVSFGQTYFSDNFDDGNLTGWTNYDDDSDPTNSGATDFDKWYATDFSSYFSDLGAGSAVSRSWASISSVSTALTPNNFLISSAIDLSAVGSTNLTLKFKTGTIEAAPYHAEHYAVYVTTSNDPATIILSTPVYEETLPSDGMFSHAIDIAASAGQVVYVTFRHYNTYDMNTLLLDDVSVVTPAADDAILVSATLNRYSMVSTDNILAMSVKNDGSTPITSLTVDWNDGTSHSSVIAVSIAAGATSTVNHPIAVNYTTALEKSISIDITAVNGGTDPNPSNNTASKLFNTVSALAQKNVLFEEGTGTWCGYCPRGAVAMQKAYEDHPVGFIGIAVHNADPMTLAAYDAGAAFTGFPGANVDRVELGVDAGTPTFNAYFAERSILIPPAEITATITKSGSAYTIVAGAVFKTPYAAANLRLGVIISEDNVTGTTSDYNQSNYYANNALGAMGGYESLPSTVPAAQMVYSHVGRALLGGYAGQSGSVPSTITDGQDVTYTFNYTLPSTSNAGYMNAVVVLIDVATGAIVNAGEFQLDQAASAGVIEVGNNIHMKVYPNPATENVKISFDALNSNYTVSILDLSGRTVISNAYSNLSGTQEVSIPVNELTAGTYMVTVSTEGVSFNEQVVIK